MVQSWIAAGGIAFTRLNSAKQISAGVSPSNHTKNVKKPFFTA